MGNVFRTWSDGLPPDVEVCGVELPGRGVRLHEPRPASVVDVVDAIAPAIVALGDAPVVLFGHSLGGLIAFEVAHRLVEMSRTPAWLFIAACPHPSKIASRPVWDDLPDGDFVERLARLEGTPRAVLENPEILQAFLPVVRADLRMFRTHPLRPDRGPLPLPIEVLAGERDTHWAPPDLDGWLTESSDARRHLFRGGHFFVQTERDRVLELVTAVLVGLDDDGIT
jgi:medium-chain acyl-[acyl-carrier-protein] hydrolase